MNRIADGWVGAMAKGVTRNPITLLCYEGSKRMEDDCARTYQKIRRGYMYMNHKITIRPEEHKDYKHIVSLILRSFEEGTD